MDPDNRNEPLGCEEKEETERLYIYISKDHIYVQRSTEKLKSDYAMNRCKNRLKLLSREREREGEKRVKVVSTMCVMYDVNVFGGENICEESLVSEKEESSRDFGL